MLRAGKSSESRRPDGRRSGKGHWLSRWRSPVACTVAAVLFVAFTDWVLLPMNERGENQRLIAWLDGASRVLQAPGLEIAMKLGVRMMHRTGPSSWLIMLALNIPFYLAGSVLLRWMWEAGGARTARPAGVSTGAELPLAASRRNPQPPPNPPRGPGSRIPEAASAKTASAQTATARTATARPPSPSSTRPRHTYYHAPASPAPSTASVSDSASPSRRQFLAAGNRLALGAAAATFGYAFAIEPHNFVITRRSVPIRGLPASLDGLTIVQITDIHHGPWTPLSFVQKIVNATNALRPDLIALTGDYVLHSPSYIAPVAAELAGLRAKIGVVGVLGNHDWWEGGLRCIKEFRRAGLPLIDNDRLYLTPDRQLTRSPRLPGGSPLAEGLCVAGIGDLWTGSPNYAKALADVPQELPRLLLSHNPDAAEYPVLRDGQYRVDLMLSGHTHGGQVWIPGLGTPMIPSAYGQKYARGLVQAPAFPVYVSCGLGTTSLPIRFGRPPEIAVIELKSREA